MEIKNDKTLSSFELARIHMISSFLQITMLLPFSHPIDTTKSRIQTRVYTGNIFQISQQIRTNGFFSMYKGYLAMYLNLILKQPAKLAVYEHIKNPLYSGLATGFIGLFVGVPMSYIKTNYQIDPNFSIKTILNLKIGFSEFSKTFIAWKYEAVKEVVGNTAFYGLYKALNTLRNDENLQEITFLHKILQKILNKTTPNLEEQKKKVTTLENGAIAGFLGTYLSYPIDTMKSHKQTYSKMSNFKIIFNDIYSQTKIPSYSNFWRGVTITATKHGIIGGFGMVLYESIKPHIKKYVLEHKQ